MATALGVALKGIDVQLATSPFPWPHEAFYISAVGIFVLTLIPEGIYLVRQLRLGRFGQHPIQLEPKLFHDEAFVVVHNYGPSDEFSVKLLQVVGIEPEPRVPMTLLPKDRAQDSQTVSGNPEAFGICRYWFQREIQRDGDDESYECYFRYEPYAASPFSETIQVYMPWTGAGWHVEVAFRIRVSSEEHEMSEEAWVRLEVHIQDGEARKFPDWVHLDVQGEHAEGPSTDSAKWPARDDGDERSNSGIRFVDDLWERYSDR